MFPTDEAMITGAFEAAEKFATEMQSTRGDVAIVVFGNELFALVERFTRSANKPVELLKHRGDMDVVRRARASGRFVVSTPDFVGGLEFDAVVLVGVDKGRVPPKISSDSTDSENFVSYATHQRLYVAITRARYRVALLGVKARGVSDLLANASVHGLVLQSDGF
jgi:superfamily I DNA/RNA helicase